MPQFRAVRTDDPVAEALLTEYFALRVRGFVTRSTPYQTHVPDPEGFEPPAGIFLVAEQDGVPVGCGGIRMLSPDRAEVKHLFVRDAARGRGIGGGLLAILEHCAIEFGATEVVLDSHESLEAAGRLYARAGYGEIAAYNENPNASRWYRKGLAAGQ